jgi:hypothetical protein
MCHFIKNWEIIDLLHNTQNHRENAKHTKQEPCHTKKESKEPKFGERLLNPNHK